MRISISLPVAAIFLASVTHASPIPGYDSLPLTLDPTNGEFPEGIAVDRRGNLYYSLAPRGEIWRATPDGELTLIARWTPTCRKERMARWDSRQIQGGSTRP